MAKEYFKNLPDATTPLNAQRINGLLNGDEALGNIVAGDIKCKNLFNKYAITIGYYIKIDGELETNSSSFYSEYIEVKGGTNYCISGANDSGTTRCVIQYDENKNYITGSSTQNRKYVFENNTKYIRISGVTSYLDTLQLEIGNVETEYTPHKNFGYESGSNENGSWVKFADGTMICRIRKTITDVAFTEWSDSFSYSAGILLPLPQTFSSIQNLVSHVSCRSSNLCWTANINTGVENVGFYILQNTPNARDVSVEITTIGYWK